MTPQEVKLWNWLREGITPIGFHVRRQVPIDRFVVDFTCIRARLVIEVDGDQHGQPAGLRRDTERDRRLAELGYEVLQFGNRQIDREKRVVLDTIYARLEERCDPRRADPSPRGEGRVGEADRGGVCAGRVDPTRLGFAESALPSRGGIRDAKPIRGCPDA